MKIPSSSISRLSIYYRTLLSLKDRTFISSHELCDLSGCSAAQIRKDFAYFGQFGRPGKGYEVAFLKTELKNILGIGRDWDVVLVGAGNLGSALLAYKGFKRQGFNIRLVFDNDTNKIGKIKQGIKIKDIRELGETLKANQVEIAIVAVPQDVAQEVIDKLVSADIKAVLNFAPIRPKITEDIEVLNIDLSMELERLTYFLQRGKR